MPTHVPLPKLVSDVKSFSGFVLALMPDRRYKYPIFDRLEKQPRMLERAQ